MSTPAPMELLNFVVLKEAAEEVASRLLAVGSFHPVDIRSIESKITGLTPSQIDKENQELETLQAKVKDFLRKLKINPRISYPAHMQCFPNEETQRLLDGLDKELEPLLAKKEELQEELVTHQSILSQVRQYFPLPIQRGACIRSWRSPPAASRKKTSHCWSVSLQHGYLPWKTLGVAETDAWGIKRSSAGDAWVGYWRYRIDRNFAGAPFTLSTGFGTCPSASSDCLAVYNNAGSSLTNTSERPVAIIYSTGPNLVADGQNASYEATNGAYQSDVPGPSFDDILIWVSRPQLFNRMVTAGKLP